MANLGVSSRTPAGVIINKDGTATFAFIKWMQGIGGTVNGSFDENGVYQGPIGDGATIDGREFLATIVQHLDNDGVMESEGIDFARIYLNQNIDYIADGAGSPIAGGKTAYAVLVASNPVAGQTIRFSGTTWLPVAIAQTQPGTAKLWIRSYDAATGLFAASQPAFGDLSGLISDVLTLTTTGTSGPATLIGSTLNVPQYSAGSGMVYPGAGIGVSTGSAWGTSINPADVPRLSTNNTFALNQTIAGTVTALELRIQNTKISNVTGVDSTTYYDAYGVNTGNYGNHSFRVDNSNGSGQVEVLRVEPTGGGTVAVHGAFTVSGAKSFKVTHPLDETKYLIHSCLEGPENGTFYRGEVTTVGGVAEVTLPYYFEALTFPDDRSILLTVIVDDANPVFGGQVAAGRITNGKFNVYSVDPTATVAWEVKAVRRIGVDRLQVTQSKQEPTEPIPTPHDD